MKTMRLAFILAALLSVAQQKSFATRSSVAQSTPNSN